MACPLVVIPMGGAGHRFREHGYTQPKALIPLQGRAMLFHILDVLPAGAHVRLLCQSDYEPYRLHDQVRAEFPELVVDTRFHAQQTRGAAEVSGLRFN